jgi:alanyl-tRNA synthetase
MTSREIRRLYFENFINNRHKMIQRSSLIPPNNDATTLFVSSGMQPLVPYLLGETHPEGSRLVDIQTCLRAQDIEEVGDSRHTTFFEMLGNWSLGDYFKSEQLSWYFNFLVDKIGLDPNRLFVTCFIGDEDNEIPRDQESAQIWQKLFKSKNIDHEIVEIGSEKNGYKIGMKQGRIFYYDHTKNWWCRSGSINEMPVNEPGGPDSEVFYEFDFIEHDLSYGQYCHPNCDCGRFVEIGNSVFMEYLKTEHGFKLLPKKNVDFGGGLERLTAASLNTNDIFRIDLFWPIINQLEVLSQKKYSSHQESMRVIADHLKAAVFLANDGVVPSNKTQGYVMRRLIRRAIRYGFDLGIENNFLNQVVSIIQGIYQQDYPDLIDNQLKIEEVLTKEEKVFRQTLRKGLREFDKIINLKLKIEGKDVFKLYDTYGFPYELVIEEAFKQDIDVDQNWRSDFDVLMLDQKNRSRTASKGTFKGGLAGHEDIHKKYHTATHLMYQALRMVLGEHVIQHGSNITDERLRFDFSHPDKLTIEEIKKIEKIVNDQIKADLEVSFQEVPVGIALNQLKALGAFNDRYDSIVKVYSMTPKGQTEPFSREICGGPHVAHTNLLAENGQKFKIIKEESSSAGIRRIKAVLS